MFAFCINNTVLPSFVLTLTTKKEKNTDSNKVINEYLYEFEGLENEQMLK